MEKTSKLLQSEKLYQTGLVKIKEQQALLEIGFVTGEEGQKVKNQDKSVGSLRGTVCGKNTLHKDEKQGKKMKLFKFCSNFSGFCKTGLEINN